jgi:hypothetical protein
MLDPRGVTLFDALWAFYREHEYWVNWTAAPRPTECG